MLIVDLGNNHFGDFKKAKEMIRISLLSGADLVKGQAFLAKDISGSMPSNFYKMCEFSFDQYVELIDYGRHLGIEVFYSIFSHELKSLEHHMNWFKVAASQTRNEKINWKVEDDPSTFVSIPRDVVPPPLEHANVLYVSEYLVDDPELDYIDFMADHYDRPCGYSDHTIGIDACVKAIKDHGANVIEKHFGLQKNMAYLGVLFRDTVHCADPNELEKIAATMKSRGVAN